ncbi:hypothetical protein Sango_3102200 [Sesamum angolense]|uniref:DUF4283 domain-containing protein n=1 Tax=Sesamum angolense TaxID=2727404 RepID=A0AAE1W114_9LAMI|nr:hypothetical protein Sango_3102200 [Sesamum angolense]
MGVGRQRGAFLQSSRKTLHFVPPTKQNGEVIIRPTKEVVDNGAKKWLTTAVGYCLGRRPYFPQLEAFARANWKGLQQVSATSSGFFFFRFTTRFAMEDVIEGGPWLFQGQPIVLQVWEQGLSLRRQKHTQIPVWVRLRHLPMEYWTEEGLSTVASGIGTPLYADSITKNCARLDYARQPARPLLRGIQLRQYRYLSKQSPQLASVWTKQNNRSEAAQSVASPMRSGSAGIAKGKDVVLYNSYSALDTALIEDAEYTVQTENQPQGPNDCSPLMEGILAEPWLVLGDFNAVVDESEVCGQAADTSASMMEFRNCIRDTGLVPLPFTGCPYTWHNCSEGPRSLWKRLDRMLVNEAWLDTWPSSSYLSALPSTSDHSPLIHWHEQQY